MSKKQAGHGLEVKIATVVAVTLIIRRAAIADIAAQLAELTAGQKDYFDHELAVIELALPEAELAGLDWAALLTLLREWQLNPVAVRHAPRELHATLHALGLSIDEVQSRPAASTPTPEPAPPADKSSQVELDLTPPPAPTPPAANAPVAAAASQGACMIVDTPVRSGQRIYARGADLVVTAIVNAGAELIADGSIHVYAPLRGRALAGASGDAQARIFALSMEAELVSIAGMYRTFDEGAPKEIARKAAEIRLLGDRLDMRPIKT